jgi:hypothetical protein
MDRISPSRSTSLLCGLIGIFTQPRATQSEPFTSRIRSHGAIPELRTMEGAWCSFKTIRSLPLM